jgi:electron transfer flavoprotein beta subunit
VDAERIVVCLKRTDLRPEIEPLDGTVHHDPRAYGTSPADAAALEWALTMGERWGCDVDVATVGPPAAAAVLREALAAGAARAVRIEGTGTEPSDVVAAALATVAAGARFVWCGDRSLDRASGSVPAFLAARLGVPQALGAAHVELGPPTAGGPGPVEVERRLERGRRERLRLTGPAVVSVEAGTARLRRASLPGVLAAADAPITTRPAPGVPTVASVRRVATRAFRPPPRVRPAPASSSPRERTLELTGVLVERTPPRLVVVEPDEGAEVVLEQLQAWGQQPGPG